MSKTFLEKSNCILSAIMKLMIVSEFIHLYIFSYFNGMPRHGPRDYKEIIQQKSKSYCIIFWGS